MTLYDNNIQTVTLQHHIVLYYIAGSVICVGAS